MSDEKERDFYLVRAETVDQVPEGFGLDPDQETGYRCNGFILAAFNNTGVTANFVHVNLKEMIAWIAGDEHLMKAAKMAILYSTLLKDQKDGDGKDKRSIEEIFGLKED